MTETEWLAANDPTLLLEFLKGQTSDRKLRLFALACCRRAWHLLMHERSRSALNVIEDCADRESDKEKHAEAFGYAFDAYADSIGAGIFPDRDSDSSKEMRQIVYSPIRVLAADAVESAAISKSFEAARQTSDAILLCAIADNPRAGAQIHEQRAKVEQTAQSLLIRDTFGNPFRPVRLNPSWLTRTVIVLANGIYSENAFNRKPILADALQDASCDREDILKHCREPGEHVRGCWLVDLLLGKM